MKSKILVSSNHTCDIANSRLNRFAEILASIEEEERVTGGVTWKELALPVNRMRVFLIIALQIGVQLTGNTSLAYCAYTCPLKFH